MTSSPSSPLNIYQREDGIHVFVVKDANRETVNIWKKSVLDVMNKCVKKEKHLHDFRQLKGLPLYAMRTGMDVKNHPNMSLVYVAIVVQHSRVMELLELAISIQPGGTFRIFTDFDVAIAWLNENVLAMAT